MKKIFMLLFIPIIMCAQGTTFKVGTTNYIVKDSLLMNEVISFSNDLMI